VIAAGGIPVAGYTDGDGSYCVFCKYITSLDKKWGEFHNLSWYTAKNRPKPLKKSIFNEKALQDALHTVVDRRSNYYMWEWHYEVEEFFSGFEPSPLCPPLTSYQVYP
jgi:hypothetical protein